jgi:MFS family permease
MMRTAQQWLVFRLTGSSLDLGIVTFASFFPILIISPFAGVLIDRVNKRRLVILAQVGFMLIAIVQAYLTLNGLITFNQVVILATLLGVVDTFEIPARQSFMIEVVGREDLSNAIALNVSSFNVARIVGPAISGIVVAQVGEGIAFAINAVSYLTVIVGLLAMRITHVARTAVKQNALLDFREGVGYVLHQRTIFILIGMVAAQAFFGMPYLSLLPIYAGDILDTGPEGLGLLLSVGGIGALAGAMTLAYLSHSNRRGLLLTVGMLTFAVSLALFALSRSMLFCLLTIAVVGWAQVTHLATTNSLLQSSVPDQLRGRVLSIYIWMHGGFMPLGALFFGAAAQRWDASIALFAGAVVFGVLGVLVLVRAPEIRRLE